MADEFLTQTFSDFYLFWRFYISYCWILQEILKRWDQYGANQKGDWTKEDGSLSFDADFWTRQAKDGEELETTLDSLKITESFANADSILLSDPQKHF